MMNLGPEGGANDILAELLDLLDLGGEAIGEGLLEGLFKSVSISIEFLEALKGHVPWPSRSSSARRSGQRTERA